jgi:hypothetical protein
MTSVPKPLKFLRPHYQTLKTAYSSMTDDSNKQKLADVISVLAITTGKEGDRESLKFRLLGSKVRSLSIVSSGLCHSSTTLFLGPASPNDAPEPCWAT